MWAACSFFHLNQDIAATETKLQNRVDHVVHDNFCVQGIEDEIQQHLHQGHAIHQEDHLYKKYSSGMAFDFWAFAADLDSDNGVVGKSKFLFSCLKPHKT